MNVGLLGPLEITTDDGTLVELPGRKPRILLALLACHVNRPVSVDMLVEAVWGSAVPLRAGASLRVYVHHLRKALGASRIGRRAEGYVLGLDPADLDIERFRSLVAEGCAVSAEYPARSVELLEAALSLWRGPALAGLTSVPLLSAEVARLEEMRLQALEQRFDAELALGRQAQAVTQLRALVVEYPLRETFRSQLMRALFDGGRGAEAVEAFEDTRRTLADELGVDPSPSLRDLHLSILRNDLPQRPPSSSGSAVPADPVVPRQLPARAAGFAGRGRLLAQLDGMVVAGNGEEMPIASITGLGGIGKTALAVHWAHRVRGEFPDGELYVNLRGFDPVAAPASSFDVLRDFLSALGMPVERIPDGVESRASLYRTVLAERRLLVVLDNARNAEQVRPLLPGSPACLVVVTSRDQLVGLVAVEGAHPINLNVFSALEARELLAQRLGTDRVMSQLPVADQIIESCAGLPLALSVVAARVAANPNLSLAAVAEELTRTRQRLDLFTGDELATDVRAVFSWSYRILDTAAARLFRLLGLLQVGPDFAVDAAVALAGLPPAQAKPLLAQLVRVHLVTEHVNGRYTFHDLMRAYAAELANDIESMQERNDALRRLLDYYLHTAHAAAVALQYTITDLATTPDTPLHPVVEFTGPDAALTWLVAERAVLVTAVSRAKEGGFYAHSWQLARVIKDFLVFQAGWHELHRIQQIALVHRDADRFTWCCSRRVS